MFCGTCGSKLPDNARFCEECGAVVQENLPPKAENAPVTAPIKPVLKVQPKAEKPPKPKKEKKKVNKGLIIGICAVLMVAVLAAVLIPVIFPRETIYVLKKQTLYNEDGSELVCLTYEYDDCARILSREADESGYEQAWDEELCVFVQVSTGLDGEPDWDDEYEYDEYGNVICMDSHFFGSIEVEYEYDEEGRFVSCQFEGTGAEYFCEYDENGNLLSVGTNYGDGRVEEGYAFEYDSQGRLKSETQYTKVSTVHCEYHYDGDQLSSVDYYTAATIPDADYAYAYSYEYTYDEDGRLEEMVRRGTEIRYEYDGEGFLESEENNWGEEIEYTCDEYGNIICAEYSDGTRFELEYEEMTVTPEQAANYRSRAIYTEMGFALGEWGGFCYGACFFYYLIPNPCWETYVPCEYYCGLSLI